MEERKPRSGVPALPESPAELHFREALASGKHWYLAILEAIGLWDRSEEVVQGRTIRYLIDGEAFDWLLVAQRLCASVNGLISREELDRLLLQGQPPLELPPKRLKEILGGAKYRAYLNYFYGVEVERALQQAVVAEVQKETRPLSLCRLPSAMEESFQRIYGMRRGELWRCFQVERDSPPENTPEREKEFTYWLFKYRLRHCDPARVASDTKKGLAFLGRWGRAFPPS